MDPQLIKFQLQFQLPTIMKTSRLLCCFTFCNLNFFYSSFSLSVELYFKFKKMKSLRVSEFEEKFVKIDTGL